MLILTRYIGQTIHIVEPDGSEIEVAVLGVKGNQVRLGIEAPEDVAIYREEVYERILREKGDAA